MLGVARSTIYRWVERTLDGDLDTPFHYMRMAPGGRPSPPWFFEAEPLVKWFTNYQATMGPGRPPGS
jgi:hypothetical protein